jgi:hypothetical protein
MADTHEYALTNMAHKPRVHESEKMTMQGIKSAACRSNPVGIHTRPNRPWRVAVASNLGPAGGLRGTLNVPFRDCWSGTSLRLRLRLSLSLPVVSVLHRVEAPPPTAESRSSTLSRALCCARLFAFAVTKKTDFGTEGQNKQQTPNLALVVFLHPTTTFSALA